MNSKKYQQMEFIRQMSPTQIINLMESYGPPNFNMDRMDIYDDDNEITHEKVNFQNKRLRENEYYQDSVLPKDVGEMGLFSERPKFTLENVEPYSDIFTKPLGEFKLMDPFINSPNPIFATRKEQQKYKKWKREQDRMEIRCLMKYNNLEKERAFQKEKEINNIPDFHPNMFIYGKNTCNKI